ncbi:tape measure protein, partial [Clostridium neonatale]|uniref:tape measure protein n=1 Tax=Clostridium neonatale TaxID=137838 RepID=UPI00374F1F33
MASIRSAIEIQDRFSSALNNLYAGLDRVVNKFETLQNVMSRSANFDVGSNLRTDLNSANTAISNINNNLNNVNNTLNNTENNLTQVNSTINNVNTNIINIANNQQKFNDTVNKSNSSMDGLIGKVKTLVGAYLGMQAVKGIIGASDEIVQTKARLDLMNDGLQTTEELQNMIFQSAQRSRGAYADTASAVAKMGILAKDAFSSNEETVAFVEQLNKQFTICGTDIAGAQAATLQLTQALASGVLRGEELNSVFEQAPTVIQAIADYLDVGIGEIRDMASEGQITADIVKKAMFAAADETNEKFESMPKTIGQIWQGIKNEALMAFQPVLLKINEIANNPGFNTLVSNVSGACGTIAIILLNIINLICSVAQVFSDNWGIIGPIIYGVIGVLGVYATYLGIINALELISLAREGALAVIKGIHALAIWATTSATWAQTTAQLGLNSAMYACPIVWIIGLIVILIAIFYAAIGAVNKFAGTSLSATGIICGAFMVAAAAIGNVIIAMANIIIDAFAAIYNFIAAFAEFFANVFNDPIGSVIRLFSSMADTVLEILEGIASAIDTLFGSNLAGAVSGWRDTLQGWTDDVAGEAKIKVERMDPSSIHFDRLNYGSAWNTGYGFGQNVENKVSNMFSTANQNDVGGTPFDYQSLLDAAEGASQGAGDTAKNTGAMKDALDITEEDLKYMRDIAEQEV